MSRPARMHDYVAHELPALIEPVFAVTARAVCEHSMGGHGALTLTAA